MNQPSSRMHSKNKENGWIARVWPVSSIYRWRSASRREQVEDALKYLLDMQWEGQAVSLGAFSAHLGISDRTAPQAGNAYDCSGFAEKRRTRPDTDPGG